MCYDGDGLYLAEFPFTGGAHGDVERTVIEVRAGFVYTMHDNNYADGPLPIEMTDYVPVEKLSLWPARLAA